MEFFTRENIRDLTEMRVFWVLISRVFAKRGPMMAVVHPLSRIRSDASCFNLEKSAIQTMLWYAESRSR